LRKIGINYPEKNGISVLAAPCLRFIGAFGIICGVERKQSMPAVMEAIDRMTTSEKFDAMSYLWSSLSMSGNSLVPDWHKRELAKTEARVAAGIERPIPWAAAKEIIKSAFS
jgi:hypothetical protein